jgi:hypothetical protein
MMTIRDWEKAGIRRAGDKPFPWPDDRAFLLVPAGAQGPGFLMLPNFRVIMKYNPAEAYALAIGHLADRLRGGEPFVQPWPRHEAVLSLEERLGYSSIWRATASTSASPTGASGRGPAMRCARSRRQWARRPTASPPPRSSTGSAPRPRCFEGRNTCRNQ